MEITANALQTVASGANIAFTDSVTRGSCSIIHSGGSGLITVRGITNQCRARFQAFFNANVAIPTGGTVAPITLAISVNGEAIGPATMISTPAAVEEFNNVSAAIYLDVPAGCCYTISVKNLSEDDVDVQNANLIIERVA